MSHGRNFVQLASIPFGNRRDGTRNFSIGLRLPKSDSVFVGALLYGKAE
jgi:hypothetical protein